MKTADIDGSFVLRVDGDAKKTQVSLQLVALESPTNLGP